MLLQRIGMNIDMQALDWGSVVQRRASREPIDKGGWSIFHTNLGGIGNVSPGRRIAHPRERRQCLVRLARRSRRWRRCASAWFDAPDLAAQQKICARHADGFLEQPVLRAARPVRPADRLPFLSQDVREGWPQFYGVKRS